jgi:hypothetical protein
MQSEGGVLTVFANGHHKPAHKHNIMAHKCGMPYTVPRAHSIHGPTPSGLANRSVDNLPHTASIEALHSESHIKDSMVSAQQEQRKVKSEHNSPISGPGKNLELLNGQLPPLDLSAVDGFSSDYSYQLAFDGYGTLTEIDQPIFSAGLSATSIDWSHYDGLDFNNNDNFATSNYSQPPSFTGFDFSSIDQPALTTTSTSGEISEVEDGALFDTTGRAGLLGQKYGSDYNSELGDHEVYRLSTASSYTGLPQAQMLASNDLGSLDIDDFIKGVSNSYAPHINTSCSLPATSYAEDKYIPSPIFDETAAFSIPVDDEDSTWMNEYETHQLSGNGTPETNNHGLWVQ